MLNDISTYKINAEIENLINKNVYPKDKDDIKVEDNDKGSALSSLGLKPKIVH